MRKILGMATIVGLALSTAACTQTEQRTAGYGMGGAALGMLAGGALTGTNQGALTGAAIGAAAGTVTGAAVASDDARHGYYRQSPAMCTYRDRYNRVFQAPCP